MINVRASSLPMLLDCAARFEAVQIKGFKTPGRSRSQLGKAVHAGAAVYDISALTGQGLTVDDASGAVVDEIMNPTEDVVWDDDLPPKKVEKTALDLFLLYCTVLAPKQSYLGVEITCNCLEITDLGITLTGTVDRVREHEGQIGIADIKTGASIVGADGTIRIAGHSLQLGVYELLAEAATGQPMNAPARILGLQAGKTAKGQRAGMADIHSPKQILLGDGGSLGVLEIASKMLKAGLFPGNPNSLYCHNKYCPIFNFCKFRR